MREARAGRGWELKDGAAKALDYIPSEHMPVRGCDALSGLVIIWSAPLRRGRWEL